MRTMSSKVKNQLEIQTVIDSAGGKHAVADACGIKRQAVEQWRKVPANHVLMLEELSGKYSRYQIRPDIFGEAAA